MGHSLATWYMARLGRKIVITSCRCTLQTTDGAMVDQDMEKVQYLSKFLQRLPNNLLALNVSKHLLLASYSGTLSPSMPLTTATLTPIPPHDKLQQKGAQSWVCPCRKQRRTATVQKLRNTMQDKLSVANSLDIFAKARSTLIEPSNMLR